MNTVIRRTCLTLFLGLLTLSGCASMEQTRTKLKKTSSSEFTEFIKKVKPLIKYRPYKDMIYYDADSINGAFKELVSNLDSSLERIKIRWGYNQEKEVQEELDKTDMPDYKKKAVMEQIEERSWAVVRLKDSADSDSAGTYSIPVALAIYIWKYHPVTWYGSFLITEIDIQGEKEFDPEAPGKKITEESSATGPEPAPKKKSTDKISTESSIDSTADTLDRSAGIKKGEGERKTLHKQESESESSNSTDTPTAEKPDPEQRLEKIKRLLEKGLIDSVDYRNKKSEILKGI
ncbi:MAG: hypothetical protein ACOCSE_04860 [Chitinivibrionales bacterium]